MFDGILCETDELSSQRQELETEMESNARSVREAGDNIPQVYQDRIMIAPSQSLNGSQAQEFPKPDYVRT